MARGGFSSPADAGRALQTQRFGKTFTIKRSVVEAQRKRNPATTSRPHSNNNSMLYNYRDRVFNPSKRTDRTLPLLANVKEYLLSLEAQQALDKAIFGNEYHDTDYICRWPDGRLLESDYVTRKFGQIIIQAEMPPIRFHDLRHPRVKLGLSNNYIS